MAKRRAGPRFQGAGSRSSGPSGAPPPEASGCPFLGLTTAPVWVPPKPWGSAGPPRPSAGHALTSFLPVSPLLPVCSQLPSATGAERECSSS